MMDIYQQQNTCFSDLHYLYYSHYIHIILGSQYSNYDNTLYICDVKSNYMCTMVFILGHVCCHHNGLLKHRSPAFWCCDLDLPWPLGQHVRGHDLAVRSPQIVGAPGTDRRRNSVRFLCLCVWNRTDVVLCKHRICFFIHINVNLHVFAFLLKLSFPTFVHVLTA